MAMARPLATLTAVELKNVLLGHSDLRFDPCLTDSIACVIRDVALEQRPGNATAVLPFVLRSIRAMSSLLRCCDGALNVEAVLALMQVPEVVRALGQDTAASFKAQLVIRCLADWGLGAVELCSVLHHAPGALGLSCEEHLQPLLVHIQESYLDDEAHWTMAALLTQYPEVLRCSVEDGTLEDVLGGGGAARQRDRRAQGSGRRGVDVQRAVMRADPFAMAYSVSMHELLRDGVWWRRLPAELESLGLSPEEALGVRDVAALEFRALNDRVAAACVDLVDSLIAMGVPPGEVAAAVVRCPRLLSLTRGPPATALEVLEPLADLGGLSGKDDLLGLLERQPETLKLEGDIVVSLLLELRTSLRIRRADEAADVLRERPSLLLAGSASELRRQILERGLKQEDEMRSFDGLMHEGFGEHAAGMVAEAEGVASRLRAAGFSELQSVQLAEMTVKMHLESQVFYNGRLPSLEDMAGTFEDLRAAGLSPEAIQAVFRDNPAFLRLTDPGGIRASVTLLVEMLEISGEEMESLLLKSPNVLSLSPEAELRPALEAMLSGARGADVARAVLSAHPDVLVLGSEKARQAAEYVARISRDTDK
eukprot:CAMPEP_0177591258 /NCGR_PEP_ID=MMETSP0419_2-20121207/7896_1 /TAXON_ID=582737 /ORGANISM="Tetraselmis sp., Strain GSL018" /LENGTH=593 /DNA_ID=CAMNT_0019081977 /DNA_START=452 /DNA_END=2233 /DNA_ORIENTATION=-